MKPQHLLILFLLLFAGCATYKQLKPEPPLSPAEQGFMELKKGKKEFKIKQGKKYFVSFPEPGDKNFYLVLDLPDRSKLNTSFTAKLVKKSVPGEKIKDETHKPENLSVFPIHKGDSLYYWLIDSVQWKVQGEKKEEKFLEKYMDYKIDQEIDSSVFDEDGKKDQ